MTDRATIAVLLIFPTAYAAWLLACPFTKWMILPLVPAVVIVYWLAHHPDKFFRQMAVTSLGISGASLAMPTIRLSLTAGDFRAGFVTESGSSVVAAVSFVVAAFFGWLELRRRQGTNPPSGGKGGNKLSIKGSTIQNSTIVGGDQHVHHSDDPSAQLDMIEPLVDHGLLPEGLSALTNLEKRLWPAMSPAQKFRHKKLEGRALLKRGEDQAGAKLFLAAADFTPNDEKAQVVRAVGYWILDEDARAHELAKDLVIRFPHLASARAIYIRSGPDSATLDDLLPKPWRGLEPEVASAAAEWLVKHGQPDEAVEVMKGASKAGEKLDYWFPYSTAYFAVLERAVAEGRTWTKAELQEILRVFGEALECCRGGYPRSARIALFANIATVHYLSGASEEQWNALTEAHKLAPDEPAIQVRRAQWLSDRKRYTEAIEILDAVLKAGKIDAAPLLISLPLWKRGQPGDHERARALLEQTADSANSPPIIRKDAVDFLIQFSDESNEWDKLREYAIRYKDVLGDFESSYSQAVAYSNEGTRDEAAKLALHLYAKRAGLSTKESLKLGVFLQHCELSEEAFQVLSPVVVGNEWTNATISLLHAARDTERPEFTIRLCQSLTAANINEPLAVDSEAVARARRGETAAAIKCVQESLRKAEHPLLRLRLSTLAVAGSRPDLVEEDPARLPQPEKGLGAAATMVVLLLRHLGKNEQAIRFAYANYRLNRSESDAWNAVLAAFSPIPGPVGHVEPTVVDDQSAIRISEDGESEWIVIESDNPDASYGELPPTQAFAKHFLGKHVGERVQAPPKGALPPREYVIEELRSKFVRCYQRCLDSWERQFPETPGPQMVVIGKTTADIEKVLVPVITAQVERVERLDRFYAENDCSLHMLAHELGGSVFATMTHVIAESPNELKCAASTTGVAQLSAALDAGTRVIVHSTALSTLLLLDETDLLVRFKDRIAIAQATLDELNAHVQEVLNSSKEMLLVRNGRAVREEKDESARKAYADRVKAFITICQQCDVFAESEHTLISHSEWDAWTRVGGAGAPESLHRAIRTKELLWTDDALISALAARRGAITVWTQLMFEHLARNMADASLANGIAARLAAWRFRPTRVPPGAFLAAAQLARWNPSSWPVSVLLDLVATSPWAAQAVVALASNVLREWWRSAPNDALANAFTVALLDRIAARPGGDAIIARVHRELETVFGLDVLGRGRAQAAMQAWSTARRPRSKR